MRSPPLNSLTQGQQPFTFSQSSLQDYADCPRRFHLRYLDRLVWPAAEAEPISENEARQRAALMFHRLVQQAALGLPVEKLTAMATSPDLARWWRNYAMSGPDLSGFVLHPEKMLAAPIRDRRLVCKYDLLAIGAGKAVIFDWKTYAKRPSDEWLAARWQTRVYRAMLVKAGAELNSGGPFDPADVSMVYWYAEHPSEPARFPYDEHQFKRDWAAIETHVAEIAQAHEFPLMEDPRRCRFCTYRSLCDRGAGAGPWREAEADDTQDANLELDSEQIGEIGS